MTNLAYAAGYSMPNQMSIAEVVLLKVQKHVDNQQVL
jgi:hypothetical protein